MGDLAKYIAEVIEFVVAGILVFASLVFLGFVLVHPDLADLPREVPWLTSGALGPVFALAVIYAVGILAEGMSRVLFERGLDSLTANRFAGRGVVGMEESFVAEKAAIAAETVSGKALARSRALRAREIEHYVALREEWRMEVVAASAPLATQVEGQLKRLRVERATALSGYIACLALLGELGRHIGDEGLWTRVVVFAAVLLVTACARWLSKERLKRYVNTIIRCHDALPRAEVEAR